MRVQIRHAVVQYAANTILEDVNFEIRDNEKIAVVGRNGCGKTTLLKLIAGDVDMANPDSDEECGISMAGKQRIGYFRQISFEDGAITAEEEILKVFAPVFACEKRMQELSEQMQERTDAAIMQEYSLLQKKLEALRGYTYRRDMETMFQKFGFSLEDLGRPIGTFSGGQQTKIAFIKLLLSYPDIMLLDEPTNHLDMPTIEWLEGYLKNYDRAVVIVSHDRMFLDRVIDVTYEIEYHRIKRYPGNYTAFMKQKEEAAARQEKDYEQQQKEIKRLNDWIEKWKNTPTKVTAARSKRKVIEHMELIEKPRRFDTKAFAGQFQPVCESYSDVLNVKGLRIGYDKELSRVSFLLKKKERLAVIGENGIGKSTLLKTLVGIIPALGGSFSFGGNVKWGYFDQQAAVEESRNPLLTVLDDFWEAYPELKEVEVRSALGSFLFTGEEVYKQLGQLSGGEKVRLALCKMLKERPNLLILDEPTNHMDIVGKEALERMLQNYAGTVIFVSHDRYFIRQIATEILDFESEEVKFYGCGYEEYLEERAKQQGKGVQARPEGRAGSQRRSENAAGSEKNRVPESRKPAPTLDDIFDKKSYYNPGKIESRLRRQLEKYNQQLEESEGRLAGLKLEQADPELAADYERLMALEEKIQEETRNQESLLERMVETEVELSEFEDS